MKLGQTFIPDEEMTWNMLEILHTTKKDTSQIFTKNILYWLEYIEKIN